MRLATDDTVDSVVDGYNRPVRRISVLSLPRGLVTCSVLKSGVVSKQAVRFKKASEHCAIGVPVALLSKVRLGVCYLACC